MADQSATPPARSGRPLKALLFDIDGTLIDSNDAHANAWVKAFAEGGRPQPFEAIRGQIGKGGDNLVPALLPDADEETTERLGEAQGRIYRSRYMGEVRAFPAVCALLRRLRSDGYHLVLASSAGEQEVQGALEIIGCGEVFESRTGKDDVDASKPHPDVFAEALATLPGCDADEVLVVGDTPYDVSAAVKCGIRTVALTAGGFGEEALRAAGAAALFRDPADLLANYDQFVTS